MAIPSGAFCPQAHHPHNRLSVLLESTQLPSDSRIMAPFPQMPSDTTSTPYMDLTNRFKAENYNDPTFQLTALNFISQTISHAPSYYCRNSETVMGNEEEQRNLPYFKNLHLARAWINQCPSHSLETQSRRQYSDIKHIQDWPMKMSSRYIPMEPVEDDFHPGSVSHFSEIQDGRRENSDEIVRISSLKFQTDDLESYVPGSNESRKKIKHSINNILKPNDDYRCANELSSEEGLHQSLPTEGFKRRHQQEVFQNNASKKFPKLNDIIVSNQRSKDVHQIQHKVVSVLTMATSSSFAQKDDVPALRRLGKSKCQSNFDILSQAPAMSPDHISVSDTRYHPSMTTHEAFCRGQVDRKTFQCPQCRYVTDRKNNLKRHIVTMHQDSGKVLECCGIPFQSKAALRDHNNVFHKGGYRCQICARNFCRKALLRRHLTVHSGQKDFFCELCGYATSHKSNLERHQKVHAKKNNESRSITSKHRCSMSSNHGPTPNDVASESKDGTDGSFKFDNAIKHIKTDIQSGNTRSQELTYIHETANHLISGEGSSFLSCRGKRARFFTSRLEETYYQKTDDFQSTSPTSECGEEDNYCCSEIEQLQKAVLCTDATNQTSNFIDEKKHSANDEKEAHDYSESTHDEKHEAGKSEKLNDQNQWTNSADELSKTIQEDNKFIPKLMTENIEEINQKTSHSRNEILKKRSKINYKNRMCIVLYQCDNCEVKLSSQQELYSHLCPKTSSFKTIGIPLVTALQKGCLKANV